MIEQQLERQYASARSRLWGEVKPVVIRRSLVLPKPEPAPRMPNPKYVRKTPRRKRDYLLVGTKTQKFGYRQEWQPVDHHNIMIEVAVEHDVPLSAMVSEIKTKRLVAARMQAYYRLYHELGYTLAMIGKVVGGRDHATVYHGLKMLEAKNNAGN